MVQVYDTYYLAQTAAKNVNFTCQVAIYIARSHLDHGINLCRIHLLKLQPVPYSSKLHNTQLPLLLQVWAPKLLKQTMSMSLQVLQQMLRQKFNGSAANLATDSYTTVVMVPSKKSAADATIIPALATVIVVLLGIITIAGIIVVLTQVNKRRTVVPQHDYECIDTFQLLRPDSVQDQHQNDNISDT